MIESVLIPCAVCGESNAEIVHCEEDCCGASPRWVQCPCGMELGGRWVEDADAVDAWNTRVVFGTSVVFQREKAGVISRDAVWVVFANCRLFCAEEYDEVMQEIYTRWEGDQLLVG